MRQLVSIVVPAYNAAERIGAALLSIAEQEHDNIEIIVVDDASTDGTNDAAGKVLKNSGRSFELIRHDINMGVSAARNTGLASASGEYVVFFDADDMADPQFVSVLLGAITENDSEAAFCGFRYRFEDTGKEQAVDLGLDPSRKYSAEELTVMYLFHKINLGLWTAVFKTSFLKAAGLEFAVGCGYLEDYEFLAKAFSRCRSINFSTGCHYIYVQHKGMISKNMQQTPEKTLRRRVYIAEAICREAQYLAKYAESPKVRSIALNLIMADGLIKTMNIAALQRDKAEFYDILRAPETRRALIASLKYLLKDPEVFLKSAALLLAPGLYFRIRSK